MNNKKGEATKKDQEVNEEKEGKQKEIKASLQKNSDFKSVFNSNKPMFVLLYKKTLLNINDLDSSLPSVDCSLLQKFEYVIPEDDPSGLPPEET